ncbi:hypothetical protein NIES4101_89050 [Calothrix sp. NIES-4101]|nr:hypothetical protein NIES4101_89050 [Calothrix sp. NIES-4101]
MFPQWVLNPRVVLEFKIKPQSLAISLFRDAIYCVSRMIKFILAAYVKLDLIYRYDNLLNRVLQT